MLNFTLPNFFQNQEVNAFLISMVKIHADKLYNKNINICAESGSAPYLSWSGGLNSNYGTGIFYDALVDFQRNLYIPKRLNMSNVLLEDYDYDDCQGQAILRIFDDGSSVIELSSIPFMEKIHNDFPNYRFMFSKQADLITEFTPELLNEIANIENITILGIPDKYTFNKEWLKQLSKKSKCEITVNPYCPVTCEKCDRCLLQEHQNQIEYLGMQNIANCVKRNDIYDIRHIVTIEDISKEYVKMGFTHYTFNYFYGGDHDFWASFYVMYFFKPEYHNIIFAEWAKFKGGHFYG